MYKNLVFRKVLLGMGMIFGSIGILFLLYVLIGNENNFIYVATLCGGLYIFVWYYVFFIYFLNIKIRPVSKDLLLTTSEEIKNKIQTYFWEALQDNKPVFQAEETRDGLQISWNRTIDFKQILNYGSQSINYKTCLFFNERKHICNIHSQIIHISKSVGLTGLSYSLDFKGGFVYETWVNYHPSFEIKNSEVHMNIKKLVYNNASMIDPIIEICKRNGWIVNFLIFKHKITRIVYIFAGWILLSISGGMIFFSIFGLMANSR